MADADGDEFDLIAVFDLLDYLAQMLFEVIAGVDRQGAVIDRGAVGDHHQDAAMFRASEQAAIGPHQRFAVDIFLQQPFAQHQAEVFARAAPGGVGGFVDDVAQIVQAAGVARLAFGDPAFAGLTAFPGAGGEAEHLGLHRAAFQGAGEDVAAHGGHRDRPAAHGAGIVDQQGHHGVAEIGVAFALERQRQQRVGDDAGEAAGIEHAFVEVEIPAAGLLRHQAALQPVGEFGDHGLHMLQLLVKLLAQAGEFLGVAEILGLDFLIELAGEEFVGVFVVRQRLFPARLRAARLVIAFGGGGVFFAFLTAFVVAGLAFHFLGLGAEHGFRFAFRLAFAVLGIVLRAGLLAAVLAVLVFVLIGVNLGFREIHRREQLAGGAGKRGLVLARLHHFLQGGIGGIAQGFAPQVQHFLRRFRRRFAGHAFAGEQGQRLMDGQLILAGHAVHAFGFALFRQAGVEIMGDAGHMGGADDLNPGLLQRVIRLPRFAARGHAGVVHRIVVMADAQR